MVETLYAGRYINYIYRSLSEKNLRIEEIVTSLYILI